MKSTSFVTGNRVRFIGTSLHTSSPEYYPSPGTVGVYQGGGWVQWPEGTTSGDGKWHAPDSVLAPVCTEACRRPAGNIVIMLCHKPSDGVLKDGFIPHMEMHGENVGEIGAPTKFKDILGRSLVVGDVVEIFNRTNVSYGDNAVCRDGSPYVMGIKSSCDGQTGATGYWKLLKKRSYREVRHGERIDGVRYVKECGGR